MSVVQNGLEPKTGAVLVIGGGIAGQRASLDLAEAGVKVYLVETATSLGGKVAQLGLMFPAHDCVLCRGSADHGHGCSRPTISPAFLDHSRHPGIEVMTRTDVVDVSGKPGDFTVTLKHRPRYIDSSKCTSCGDCAEVCKVELADEFQGGMSKRKAVYKTAPRAVPDAYAIDKGEYCENCKKCVEACEAKAIDLGEEETTEKINVGAVILATGYDLYDPSLSEEFGYGRYPNVLSGIQYERMVSRHGPTGGVPERPSDGKMPKKVAWLQCIGSRDQNHSYCSSFCCMYATKQAVLTKQRSPETDCEVFMMDTRAYNKQHGDYFNQAKNDFGVDYSRCRISSLKEDPKTKDILVRYETEDGRIVTEPFDLVVLSVGAEPTKKAVEMAQSIGVDLNQWGFAKTTDLNPLHTSREGIYVCGAFASPKEMSETLSEADGAAAQALTLLAEADRVFESEEFPEERSVESEQPKVGVFVCACGSDVAKVVDVDAVVESAKSLRDVAYVERLDYGCSADSAEYITNKMKELGLNRLVVAGCSPRTHEGLFQNVLRRAGLNYGLLDIANLRDQCAWVHAGEPEKATEKAKDLTAMAVGRARTLLPVKSIMVQPVKRVLVIGGGVAGMNAALNSANEGFDVILVEKEAGLGGSLRSSYTMADGSDPQAYLQDMIEKVQSNDRIKVLLGSKLESTTGSVGNFRSKISREGGDTKEVDHGAVILATGGQESRPDKYLLGKDERVVTLNDFERLMHDDSAKVKAAKSVVMIECVKPEGVDYCSRTCCTDTVKNAIKVKEMNPGAQVYLLFKELMTYGFREELYTEARRKGVVFVRYSDEKEPKVEVNNGKLRVEVEDPALKEKLALTPDLLVLATVTLPASSTQELAKTLGLPLSKDGFFMEAHLKMRPTDFVQPGIFMCGTAQYPKFIEEAISQAAGVAARAAGLLAKEQAVFRGEVASVEEVKCAACLTCVRVCPFDVPFINENGKAEVDPTKCQGCGTCAGECPAKAIRLFNYWDSQVLAKTKALRGKFEDVEEVATVGK